jgi:hypothetical protein
VTIFTEGSSWHGWEFYSLRMPSSSPIWASSQSTTITPWAGTSAQMCLINLDKEISWPYSSILVSMHYWVDSGLRRHVPYHYQRTGGGVCSHVLGGVGAALPISVIGFTSTRENEKKRRRSTRRKKATRNTTTRAMKMTTTSTTPSGSWRSEPYATMACW